ncbi:hypothetical protein Tco_1185332 [Tanacetum coccineum]
MSTSNQQTLAESGAFDRPPILEKGSYVQWASRFRRFLDNKQEEGEWMWRSIEIRLYVRQMITDPEKQKPLSKMTKANKKQYFADMKERIKRSMHGYEITEQVRHSRLMNEFDKFVAVEGESLTSVYERITTLVNVMDRNNVRPLPIFVNTKFLNSLQLEWRKYVTMTRQNYNLKEATYDKLFDTLCQFEPHVNASKAKKAARNHDPLALVDHSNFHSSHSHASPLYSHTPQPYYPHPSLVINYEEDYQGELEGDAQEDKLTTAMMLLVRAITQKLSTPTNNRLRTSSNTRNQAVIQNGRVDIQSKNVGYAGNGNKNTGRQNKNQATNAGNGLVQQIEEDDQIVQWVPRTKSNPGKTNFNATTAMQKATMPVIVQNPKFVMQNDTLEELTAALIMMARIQPADDKGDAKPKYDADAISEVNASQINLISGMLSKGVHEDTNHEKLKNVINTFGDDQIDSNIIFDDPYVKKNSGTYEHDSNAYDQSFDIESLVYNVQKEAENQQIMNDEPKKKKTLLQKELETCKERVKTIEKKPVHFLKYKEAYEELEREIHIEKDTIDRLLKEKDKIQDLEEKLSSHDRIVYKMGQ